MVELGGIVEVGAAVGLGGKTTSSGMAATVAPGLKAQAPTPPADGLPVVAGGAAARALAVGVGVASAAGWALGGVVGVAVDAGVALGLVPHPATRIAISA
jgi:hypothetical protein